MKIFNKGGEWSSKVNFIDENNVVLGYDTTQWCCEHAGWFIADIVKKDVDFWGNDTLNTEQIIDLPGFNFDPTFFMQIDTENHSLDEGRMVIFRVVNSSEERFVHLFNVHNGYYGHGFEFECPGNEREGIL